MGTVLHALNEISVYSDLGQTYAFSFPADFVIKNWSRVVSADNGATRWFEIEGGGYYVRYEDVLKDVSTDEGNDTFDALNQYVSVSNTPPSSSDSVDNGTYLFDPSVIGDVVNSNLSDSEFNKIRNIEGVFGLPYQFLPSADMRLDGSVSDITLLGQEYAENIIQRIPLLFMSPGKASFMTKFGENQKKDVLGRFFGSNRDDENMAQINDLLNGKSGRYYTFEYTNKEYYQYVNPMCRIAAVYLGLTDYYKFDWQDETKSRIHSIGDFGDFSGVPFYLDTDTSISESFSNSTTQSMIASTVNGISDMGREVSFLFGAGAGADVNLMDNETLTSIGDNVGEMIQNLLNGKSSSGFLEKLGTHLAAAASGGRLIFPEIWADSSFSRTYECSVKLVAPDPSPLSIYINILVPLFHLIGFVAPQCFKENPNAYFNPFLVRATYKGFFNIDTGIITDMSITKGAECQWTRDGIPTSVVVNFSIKDLYQVMSITSTESSDWKYDTMDNTAQMDYIATWCGVNVFEPEVARLIEMWYINNVSNRVQDFFQLDIWGGIQDKVQNGIMNMWRSKFR